MHLKLLRRCFCAAIASCTKHDLCGCMCFEQSYVMGGSAERGGPSGRGEAFKDGSDSDDDEGRPLIRDHFFRDPQLVEINQKIEELTKRNNFLEGTASGLQDLLNASKKREKDHLQQVRTDRPCCLGPHPTFGTWVRLRTLTLIRCCCVAQNLLLVAKAQQSEEIMTSSLQKLDTFEKDMRFSASREVNAVHPCPPHRYYLSLSCTSSESAGNTIGVADGFVSGQYQSPSGRVEC